MTTDELIEEMFGRQEELHPDLQPYVETIPGLGKCIRHPLIYSMFHVDQLNAVINRGYQQKVDAVARAYEKLDFESYVFLHERPYRVDAFRRAMNKMSDVGYWKLLARIWMDSENIRETQDKWVELLRSNRPRRHEMMSVEERRALIAIPHRLSRMHTPAGI